MKSTTAPLGSARTVTAVDYHCEGEPFRIVTGFSSVISGRDMMSRRDYVRRNLDWVRRLLVDEPRGHADMYGGLVTPPADSGALLGVLFMHNDGYSTACGHGTIALASWMLDSGLAGESRDAFRVDVPSGRVTVRPSPQFVVDRLVSFGNVPAHVVMVDHHIASEYGPLTIDVAFGGAFYICLDVNQLGISLEPDDLPFLALVDRAVRKAFQGSTQPPVYPGDARINGIYGVIFYRDLSEDSVLSQRNVTFFADGQVDRSPCGSGTSARLALLHHRGEIQTGQMLRHKSILGTEFLGVVDDTSDTGGLRTVSTSITGRAFPIAAHTFLLDPRDPVGLGFRLPRLA